MKREIKITDPIYNDVLYFLKEKNIDITTINKIGLTSRKNVRIIYKNKNTQQLFTDTPRSLKQKIIDSRNNSSQNLKELSTNNSEQDICIENNLYEKWWKSYRKIITKQLYTGYSDSDFKPITETILKNNPIMIKTENKYIKILQIEDNITIKYKQDKKRFEFILSNSYNTSLNFIRTQLKNNNLDTNNIRFKSGYGLFFGNTNIIVKKNNIDYQIPLHIISVLKSRKKWQTSITQAIIYINEYIENCERVEYEKLREEAPIIYGSILAKDIVKIVFNQSYTKEEIINILRDKFPSRKIKRAEKYNPISDEYIKKVINKLLEFNFLKQTKKSKLIKEDKKILFEIKTDTLQIKEHIQNGKYLCFYELAYIFEKRTKSDLENFALFNAVENIEFLCFYKDKYIEYIKKFPNYITLFKMKYENGFYNGKEKLITETIIKIIL